MFDFVRRHNKILQFLLLVLIVPSFVLWGVQGYSTYNEGANAKVAMVDGHGITQAEWDNAHREQSERMRRQSPNVDPKLLDSAQARRESLEGLVRDSVMRTVVAKQNLMVSNERIQRLFQTDPELAFLRTPDGGLNKAILAAQGMSPAQFEQRLRQDLTFRQVFQGVSATSIAPAGHVATAFDALLQQREVQIQRFNTKDYLARINPSDAELEAYYKDAANAAQFQSIESADIEYLVLDLDALKKDVKFSEDDLRSYYKSNEARYTVAEERRASHILIKADQSASAQDKAKAKSKAEELLAQLRKAPASFADVARAQSQDPGSAAQGGDLNFFSRGGMVKPFDDAVFAMKAGEISNVVETEFGYHIITLTAVRGGEKKSFDSVRAEIEDEVRKQLAQKRYVESADQFSNLVYEQADSLKPAAEKFGLKIQTANVQRGPASSATGVLASPKLLDAVFGAESLRNKHNTEALETAPSQMVSARVLRHNAAHLQPFAEVKQLVRDRVLRKQAIAQASKDGQERLEALKKSGEAAGGLEPAQVVSRVQARDLSRSVVEQIMRADASHLPVVIGVDGGEAGYVVARINKVLPRDPAVVDPVRAGQQYAQAWTNAEAAAYYAALKARFKVEITAAANKLIAPETKP
jgi:peptidyl-prolyl cis-trans isomerase D